MIVPFPPSLPPAGLRRIAATLAHTPSIAPRLIILARRPNILIDPCQTTVVGAWATRSILAGYGGGGGCCCYYYALNPAIKVATRRKATRTNTTTFNDHGGERYSHSRCCKSTRCKWALDHCQAETQSRFRSHCVDPPSCHACVLRTHCSNLIQWASSTRC